jgi:hypothetical protein
MMAESPAPTLREAYERIKAGKRAEAAQILQPYLREHPQDADAWWLMAHAVSQPDARLKCLEEVVALDPNHPKAGAKLEQLRAELAATAFVMPADLVPAPAEPDDGYFAASPPSFEAVAEQMPGMTQAAGDPFASAAPRIPDKKKADTELVAGIAFVAVAVVILIGALLWAADRKGWIDLDGVPPSKPLDGRAYTLEYPQDWVTRCTTGQAGQRVCGIASEASINDLSLYTGAQLDYERLMDENPALTGEASDDPVVAGVVMDMDAPALINTVYEMKATEDEIYDYVHQAFSDTDFGDFELDYDRDNWTIDGHRAQYYRGEFKADSSAFGDFMGLGVSDGCVTTHSIYLTHGDRLLWASFYAYTARGCNKLPDKAIEHLLKSIELK